MLLDLNVGNGKLLLGVRGIAFLHQCDVAGFDNNSQLTLKNRKGEIDDIKYYLTLDAKIKNICVL